MAVNENTKRLQTRIALKYDTYANWTAEDKGANLVLLKGEIGLCEIPANNTSATNAPTVLFKVGDGVTPFKTLNWASALAADVYEWAKAKTVAVETIKVNNVDKEYLVFKDANGNEITSGRVDLSRFALASDVTSVTGALEGRIAAVEAKFSGDASVEGQIAGLDERLDVIEGSGEGSIAKAVADAVADLEDYADGVAATAKSEAISEVVGGDTDTAYAKTIKGAKEYATALNTAMDTRVGSLEGTVSGHTTAIGNNATAIADEKTAREEADTAINNKIGTLPTGEGAYTTVVAGIEAAKQAGIAAANTVQGNLNTLSGTVTQNTTDIGTNAGNITRVEGLVTAEVARATGVEAGFEGRIAAMEAFFEGAAADEGEGENLKNALDTLKEIQDFATSEGTAAESMLAAIGQNADDIDTLEGRMDAAENGISTNSGLISGLDTRVTAAEGSITALQSDMTQAKTDITNLGNNKLDKSVYETYINGKSMSDDELKSYADGKASAAQSAAEGTAASALSSAVGTINGEIAKLQAADTTLDGKISTNATNIQTNATNITNEETARKAADEAIEKKIGGTYSESATVTMAIADAKKAGTDAASVASSNTGRIAAIEGDYLKAADFFFIDCGTSTEVVDDIPSSMKR